MSPFFSIELCFLALLLDLDLSRPFFFVLPPVFSKNSILVEDFFFSNFFKSFLDLLSFPVMKDAIDPCLSVLFSIGLSVFSDFSDFMVEFTIFFLDGNLGIIPFFFFSSPFSRYIHISIFSFYLNT